MAEAFVPAKSKAWVGIAAAIGLAVILGLTCLAIGPEAKPDAAWAKWPLWNFYQFDALARFYKIFALVSTIFVVLMSVDYRKILARFTDHPGSENGTGEYYALPVFRLRRHDVPGLRQGPRRGLRRARTRHRHLLHPRRLHAPQCRLARSRREIPHPRRAQHRLPRLRHRLGVRRHRHHEPCQPSKPRSHNLQSPTPLLFGIALVMVGLGFKIGAVPMQVWIPDVYQGAPTPTTAFLSVGSKAAGFILMIRFLDPFLASEITRGPVLNLLLILAVATLLVRKPGRHPADQLQAPARLFLHRPRRIPAARARRRQRANRGIARLGRRSSRSISPPI